MPTGQLARSFITGLEGGTDSDLLLYIAEERTLSVLRTEFSQQFSRTRSDILTMFDVTNPDAPTFQTAGLTPEKRETLYEKISQWREFDPQTGTHLLLKMNRPQLQRSAQFDASRISRYGLKMIIKNRLAELLPNDDDLAEDHVTEERLTSIIQVTREEMTRGNFRLKIKPFQALPRPNRVPRQTDGRNTERPEADRGLAAS